MDADSKVRQLPLVNKTWNRACQSPASWRGIRVFTAWPRNFVSGICNNITLIQLAPRLSRLELLWCVGSGLMDCIFSSVIEMCGPRLRTLHIDLTDDRLLTVATSAPNLRFVSIHRPVSAHGLATALPFLRQLRGIHIEDSSLVCALYDIGSCCPFLQTYRGYVDGQMLTCLSVCGHLTELDVCVHNGRIDLTTAMAGLLESTGRNLLSIDFPYCDGSVVLPFVAQHCKKLTTLFTTHFSIVNDDLMEEVLSNCGSTLMYIAVNELCTDASLRSIAAHCPNLVTLDLIFNTNVTDDGVAAIAASCCNLRQISLRWTNVTGVSLMCLVEHPALRVVIVSDWATEQYLDAAHARRAMLGFRAVTIVDSVIDLRAQSY
jgi:hypothetical protein